MRCIYTLRREHHYSISSHAERPWSYCSLMKCWNIAQHVRCGLRGPNCYAYMHCAPQQKAILRLSHTIRTERTRSKPITLPPLAVSIHVSTVTRISCFASFLFLSCVFTHLRDVTSWTRYMLWHENGSMWILVLLIILSNIYLFWVKQVKIFRSKVMFRSDPYQLIQATISTN